VIVSGISFVSDEYFAANSFVEESTSFGMTNVSNALLLDQRRFGLNGTGYSIPVSTGRYNVTLGFTEIYYTTVGKRIFSVSLEDDFVIRKLDIRSRISNLGDFLQLNFTVDVYDGLLDILFFADTDFAVISCFMIVQDSSVTLPSSPNPTNLLAALDCGGNVSLLDSNNTLWNSDKDSSFSSSSITGVANSMLLESLQYRYLWSERVFPVNNTGYELPYSGNLTVNLWFVDFYFTAKNQRVFDVILEGSVVLSEFDIIGTTGSQTVPIMKSFQVQVNDGSLSITFVSYINYATISGIEIYQQ